MIYRTIVKFASKKVFMNMKKNVDNMICNGYISDVDCVADINVRFVEVDVWMKLLL